MSHPGIQTGTNGTSSNARIQDAHLCPKPLALRMVFHSHKSWRCCLSTRRGSPVSEKALRALRKDFRRRTCLTICLALTEKISVTGLNEPVGSSLTVLWVDVRKVFLKLHLPLNFGCSDGHGCTSGLSLWEIWTALSTASSTAPDQASKAASVCCSSITSSRLKDREKGVQITCLNQVFRWSQSLSQVLTVAQIESSICLRLHFMSQICRAHLRNYSHECCGSREEPIVHGSCWISSQAPSSKSLARGQFHVAATGMLGLMRGYKICYDLFHATSCNFRFQGCWSRRTWSYLGNPGLNS